MKEKKAIEKDDGRKKKKRGEKKRT
jgi:hypothetical protein